MSASVTPMADPLIGTSIEGRYVVESVLGRGGMGVVYEGVQQSLARPVAIKVLGAGFAGHPDAVARFLREARTASSVVHGNIVPVSDLGTLPDGRPYLVMPLISGQDLGSVLHGGGPLPPPSVAKLLSGVAAALDVLHAKGYVHRDIKPDNLMLVRHEDGSETAMLLDFGIVALVAKHTPRLTANGDLFGTPAYMAPEVLQQSSPEPSRDVYALAITAFELITGGLPFDAEDPYRLVQLKREQPPRTLREVAGKSFSPDLEAVFARALHADVSVRYGSAGALANALRAIAAVEVSEPVPPVRSARSAGTAPSTPVSEETEAPTLASSPVGRSRRQLGWLALAAIAPAAIGFALWPSTHAESSPSSAGKGDDEARPTSTAATSVEASAQPALGSTRAADAVVSALPDATEAEPEPEPEAPAAADGADVEAVDEPARSTDAVRAEERRRRRRSKNARAAVDIEPKAMERAGEAAAEPAGEDVGTERSVPARTDAPDGSGAHDVLAEAQRALFAGQLQEADRLFLRATKMAPGNVAAWRGLGLTSERLGQTSRAIRAFRTALALAPSGKGQQRIRERLSKLTASTP